MRQVIVLLMTAYCLVGYSQTAYEKGMQSGLGLWSEGKTNEAIAMFERIAAVEKENWLPNYYIALVCTTTAFNTKDKTQIDAMLKKAQVALDTEIKKIPNHPELLVMQAMIHTAWINFDPMTNGMKLSGTVMALYGKAEGIAPENPRVVLSKTDFEMGTARFFGTDTKPLCAQAEKAVELFSTFKPESAFHPNWGLERAQGMVAACK